jgi:hypothetical protein
VARPDAGWGRVAIVTRGNLLDGAGSGDFILSRVNAPLIGLCLSFWRTHRPATILGKEFGENLVKKLQKYARKSVGRGRAVIMHLNDTKCIERILAAAEATDPDRIARETRGRERGHTPTALCFGCGHREHPYGEPCDHTESQCRCLGAPEPRHVTEIASGREHADHADHAGHADR